MAALSYVQESWFQDIPSVRKSRKINLLPFNDYDAIIVSFSGGKDSLASYLKLIDLGVPKNKIILWHQNVDGAPGDLGFADWPVTHSYVTAFAEAQGVKVEFQWRKKGFYGELFKENAMSQDVEFTYSNQHILIPTTKAKIATRRKFPALSSDLRTRWCSSILKADPCTKVLTHYPDYNLGTIFNPYKILIVSGERRQESTNRAKYPETLLHPANSRSRLVHWLRIVIEENERDIWDRIEKHKIMPHPAYILGWSRVSCMLCVFSSPTHLAILREIIPERFNELVRIEKELGFTMDPKLSIIEKANLGSLDRLPKDARTAEWIKIALGEKYAAKDITVDKWTLPAGAFQGNSGGTN